MTAKRFTLMWKPKTMFSHLWIARDNGKQMNAINVVDELNALHEENQHYKHILQDLGLLMTDEEVIDIRIEMAEKILKPLLKRNGFNVDVDCEHGFKIIPKGESK